ncbi:MAG: hypothetical protein KAS73_04660 [Candidatus Sabulitectum sp.]|nr:hypothetical protein [Candidatus Sabulitectum sp.]
MRNAPLFIIEKIRRGEISGSFEGAVLLADISGFTSRFEKVSLMGTEGAELVSSEVSNTLTAVVEISARFGGFPVSFAGDAVTVVFPESMKNAQSACELINGLNSTDVLPLRSYVGKGRVVWDAIPMRGWTFYSFQGSAVRHAAMSGSDCSGKQAVLSSGENESTPFSSVELPAECFTPPDLFNHSTVNEFRQVTSIFLSMENRTGSNCPRSFQELVLEIAEELGGFVSGLEAGKDDYHILVVFGAPVSREDDYRRADLMLQKVFSRANGRVKAGIANGLVFSGLLKTPLLESYTVLGPSVNLAARLHSSAGWNSVYSGPVFNRTSHLGIRGEKEILLKGISFPVKTKILSPWKNRIAAVDPIPPLIERDELLEQLKVELENSNTPILLTGPTGIGKTRLAKELSGMMGKVSVLSILFERSSGGSSNGFSRWLGEWMGFDPGTGGLTAFREKLYSFIDELEELNQPAAHAVSDELLRAESVLAAMVGLHWERSLYQGLDPRGRLHNTVSVTSAFIRGHCLLRKTVLLFDDIQFMDPDSVVFLAAVLEELGFHRPSVLLLARPGQNSIMQELGLTPVEKKLSPLSRDGCMSFLKWSLDTEPLEKLLDWFHRRTEGIPFFMEQYALMLTSSGEIPDEESFPGNIHALLVARLDRLKPLLREAVLAASVLGRVFDPRILKNLTSDQNINEALHKGVADRVWERTADGLFSFIHILMRETAYNLQIHSERRKLHTRAAEKMITLWGSMPEKALSIAYHLEQSDSKEESSIWFMKAGVFSFSRSLITACHEQMQKVLSLSSDTSIRLDAHKMIYDLHTLSGDLHKAEEAINIAASEDNNQEARARVQMMRVNLATNIGKPKEAEDLILGIEEANPLLRPQILNHRGRILMLQARPKEAMHLLLDLHEELKNGNKEEKLVAIKALGNASGCMLRLHMRAEAEEPLKQVLAFAMQTGNLVMETLAVGNLALVYKYLPLRQSDAIVMARRHLELAIRTGSRFLELQAVGNLGSLLEREASTPEVFELLEKAMELSRKYGGNEAVSISLANLGKAFQRVGKLDQALESMNAAHDVCIGESMKIHQLDYTYEMAHILMDMGRIAEAAELVSELDESELPDDYAITTTLCMCRLLRLQNRQEEAIDRLEEALEVFTKDWDQFDLLQQLFLCTDDKRVLNEFLIQGEKIYREMPQWDLRVKLDEMGKLSAEI